MDVGNLITGSSAFLKSSLNLYNFLVHVLLKPILENFEYYFAEWGPREAFWWLQPPEGPWARLPSQAASRLLTLRNSARFGVSTSLQQRRESVVACCWVQIRSVAQSCSTLCDPMNRSTPGLPVHHQLPGFTQTHIHRVSDAIQPSHPLSSPSPPAPNPSQHQSLFQWVNSSHEMAKVLEFQL